jgi:RNA polymerase sigma-70 factor (ECF subfamily)
MTTTEKARFASLSSDSLELSWGSMQETAIEPPRVGHGGTNTDSLEAWDGRKASRTSASDRTTSRLRITDDTGEWSGPSVDQPVTAELTEATWSDEELLICYRTTGRRSLFDALVRRYEQEIYSYLCRYLGNADLAEDVFQATFLSVHLKCDQFEPGRKVRPWLYAVATNAAIDAQRRARRHRSVSLDQARIENGERGNLADLLECPQPSPDAEFAARERGEWVQQALSELTDQMRSVLNLVYYQGLKYREAAEILQVPVGTVKSRVHAAVQKLNEYWQKAQSP